MTARGRSRGPAVVLVQLPLPDADGQSSSANVALAAGSLKAYAVSRGVARAEDVLVLPRVLAGEGGDEAVVAWIADRRPAVAGFTTHMWSLGRNLLIAERLRSRSPGTRILFGGPEVVAGQAVLANPLVDSCIVGEGEEPFARALFDIRSGRLPERVYRAGAPLDLAALPDPWTSGYVEREPADPLYLETMRGCPHRCTYCYYAKEFEGVRTFPSERLAPLFAWAAERRVPEIYLMDPTFNAQPRSWEAKLEALAAANRTGIPLHTELRLESVDARRAAALARAGLRSVEVGLQSTNPRALHAVRRSWDRDRFLRGAAALAEAGIVMRTGVILGLPEDTAEGFRATVEFLVDASLADEMEVYPLCVLPGTELRARAAALGLEWMPFPPYWVLSTPTMSTDEMARSIRWLEEELDAEFDAPVIPRLADPAPGLVGLVDLRGGASADEAMRAPERLANRLAVLVDVAGLRVDARRQELRRFGSRLMEATPSSLVSLVVESEEPLEAGAVEDLLESFHDPGHYFNQCHQFSDDPQGRFSVRLFRLCADPRSVERGWDAGEPAEPILRFRADLAEVAAGILERQPLILVQPEAGTAQLDRLYEGQEQLLLKPDRRI